MVNHTESALEIVLEMTNAIFYHFFRVRSHLQLRCLSGINDWKLKTIAGLNYRWILGHLGQKHAEIEHLGKQMRSFIWERLVGIQKLTITLKLRYFPWLFGYNTCFLGILSWLLAYAHFSFSLHALSYWEISG